MNKIYLKLRFWFFHIAGSPARAWYFAMRHPNRAFSYALVVLVAAWLSRLVLSIVALALIIGSLNKLYGDRFL